MSILFFITLLTFFSLTSHSENQPKSEGASSGSGEAFGIYIENDTRRIGGPGSDNAYSSGFKASYIYAEDKVPKWAKNPFHQAAFLDEKIESSKVNFGLSFGHQIYTPHNTGKSEFIPDDRPYAAWMYLGFAVSSKNLNDGHFLELDVGILGPSALGKQIQNGFHDFIHEPRSQGWNNGLHDEPTLQLFYQKRFKTYQSKYFDLVPYYGGGFGNVQIGLLGGGLVRLGLNLPDDFGPSRPSANDGDSFISPADPQKKKNSYYVFAGATGYAVARNIFLDGNTFQDSPRVKKNFFNFGTEVGLGLQVKSIGAVWRFVTRSPEFKQRNGIRSFASVNVVYYFN